MTGVRIFFVGGLMSFRALFGWMRPSLYVLTSVVSPIFQILLFLYIGRVAELESDEFYVVGNAIQYASVPCLWGMMAAITGERFQNTLGYVLVTPAARLPLFLGRSLPVIVNGAFTAVFSLAFSALLLDLDIPVAAAGSLAFVVLVSAFSCTGLGLVCAGIGLRVRETPVLMNIVFGLLLVFTGANVPLDAMPSWMSTVAEGIPLTHGIEAARRIADGAALGDVGGLVGEELLIGTVYGVVGFLSLRWMEQQSFKHATLERS